MQLTQRIIDNNANYTEYTNKKIKARAKTMHKAS